MDSPDVIRDMLAQAMATEHHWIIFPGNDVFKITDGVKLMAEMCGAFWLLTEIFIAVHKPEISNEGFIVWRLAIDDDSGMLTADDGNGSVLFRKRIPFTDFPLHEGITLYWCDNVLLLPSEY